MHVNYKMTTCKCDNSNLNFDVYYLKYTQRCILLIHCVNGLKNRSFVLKLGQGLKESKNTYVLKSNVLCFSTTEQWCKQSAFSNHKQPTSR